MLVPEVLSVLLLAVLLNNVVHGNFLGLAVDRDLAHDCSEALAPCPTRNRRGRRTRVDESGLLVVIGRSLVAHEEILDL